MTLCNRLPRILPLVVAISVGLLAGCGADGEPETPTRAQALPLAVVPSAEY